jgi:uncharacterized cupin superfamily protein
MPGPSSPSTSETGFDLSRTYVHLGLGSTAVALPDFRWDADSMRGYVRQFVKDRDEGRLVGIVSQTKDWARWECHLGGDEVVVLLSGRCEIVQEVDGQQRVIPMTPGQAVINPRGVWHTSNVQEPGQSLFIAAGRRTDYRPR